jgi:hypothetical protein
MWKLVDIDGLKEIQNFSTGDYMHIENLLGYVQCTPRLPGDMSSKWSLEYNKDGFVLLKSEFDTLDYIHIEKQQNQAWYGTIDPSWWSTMWILEPVIVPTSVKNLINEKSVTVFPNPSNGDFTLSSSDFSSGEKVRITIFNLIGQVMFSNSYWIDGSGFIKVKANLGNTLSPGNYYLVAKGNSNTTRAKLLIFR